MKYGSRSYWVNIILAWIMIAVGFAGVVFAIARNGQSCEDCDPVPVETTCIPIEQAGSLSSEQKGILTERGYSWVEE